MPPALPSQILILTSWKSRALIDESETTPPFLPTHHQLDQLQHHAECPHRKGGAQGLVLTTMPPLPHMPLPKYHVRRRPRATSQKTPMVRSRPRLHSQIFPQRILSRPLITLPSKILMIQRWPTPTK